MSTAAVLQIDPGSIRLAFDGKEHSFDPADDSCLADVNAACERLGVRRLLVAFHSSFCISATFPVRRRKGTLTPQAVGFALEDQAPVSAETHEYDYVEAVETVFAVAVSKATLGGLKTATDSVQVLAQCPAAVLAAQTMMPSTSKSDYLLAFEFEGLLHLFECRLNKIRTWKSSQLDAQSVSRELAAYWLNSEAPAGIAYLADGVPPGPFQDNFDVRRVESDASTALATTVANIASGRTRPAIDFGRSSKSFNSSLKPIERPLTGFLVVATLCCIGLGVAFLQRSGQHAADADAYRQQEAAVFKRIHPNERVPTGIRRRLESTLRERTNLSGDSGVLPADPKILQQVHAVINAVPSDMRLRVSQLKFDNGRISLVAETRTSPDALALQKALQTTGLVVPSPSIAQGASGTTTASYNMSPAVNSEAVQ